MTSVRVRMIRGENQYNSVSRFMREIPRELTDRKNPVPSESGGRQIHKDAAYIKAKEAFRTKTFDPKQFKVVKADCLDYGTGDRVSHVKFGAGTVLEITEGGRDYEVKVDFDRAGVKRMFASFAKLKKIESL